MNDILNTGGDFIPELEVQIPSISKEEEEELKREMEEIKQMRVLSKSPAWKRVRDKLLNDIERMKYKISQDCDNNASLESIGQQFRIYQLCEQKIRSMIEEVEEYDVQIDDGGEDDE